MYDCRYSYRGAPVQHAPALAGGGEIRAIGVKEGLSGERVRFKGAPLAAQVVTWRGARELTEPRGAALRRCALDPKMAGAAPALKAEDASGRDAAGAVVLEA